MENIRNFVHLHNHTEYSYFDGIRNFLKRVKAQNLGEIMTLFALYNPVTLQLMDEYIKRKDGVVPIEYEHPLMEEILIETYGLIVYQEQIIQIINKLVGFSMGKADLLRRAMAKRGKYSIEEYKTDFINGAEKNNIDSTTAEKIFHNLEKNSPHAFNKSHLVAYTIIAYQTAYLKANYPKEFISETESLENLLVQESNNRISK